MLLVVVVHRLVVLLEGLVIDLTICLIFYLHYYDFCCDSRVVVELQPLEEEEEVRLVEILSIHL